MTSAAGSVVSPTRMFVLVLYFGVWIKYNSQNTGEINSSIVPGIGSVTRSIY